MKRRSPEELATEPMYYLAMGITIAAIYAYAPQSRIRAIAHLKMGDLVSMYDSNLVLSDLAKTRQRYGPQPILFTADILEIMTFFVDKVRVHLVVLNPELDEPYALIFISRRGFPIPTKLANVPRQLKYFFIKAAGTFMSTI